MSKRKIRYAVVGLGHISQVAVLPAFAHARESCELAALVSGNNEKLQELGKKYGVQHLYGYADLERCLKEAAIDAVYIALPNHLHRDFTVRAARAGAHVLCEKPMAVTAEDCRQMIDACRENNVKLMIAYRLHFEEANLTAVDVVQSGRIGEPVLFDSVFTMAVREGNIRANPESIGGGPIYDIGVYCINAARYLFQREPIEVFAMAESPSRDRLPDVHETVQVSLRFPGGRLGGFVVSASGAPLGEYGVVGTRGNLLVREAYGYVNPITHELTVEGNTERKNFEKRDQFAPELIYFADCILSHREPEPSGIEGLIDIQIVEAILRSVATNAPVHLALPERRERPTLKQEIERPAVKREPDIIDAVSPGKKSA
jgi:glucose-fructose oxidoreductase